VIFPKPAEIDVMGVLPRRNPHHVDLGVVFGHDRSWPPVFAAIACRGAS
jgi:hypothetical protein